MRLFAPLVPMLYLDILTDAMTKGLGQQVACVRYNIFTSCLDVALLWILLPRLGIRGYYCSFVLTHAVNFALSIRRLLRASGLTVRFSAPLRAIAAALGAAGLCGLLPWSGLGRAAAYGVMFWALCRWLKLARGEDLLWIRRLNLGKIEKKRRILQ